MMENQMQLFENAEFGKIGVIMIGDKPHFPAAKCAEKLGYVDTTNAIKQHCRWVVKHHIPHPQNPEKELAINIIPEGDLYRLIIRSKLPEAEKFETWIFDEVIPSIRNQGAYITENTLKEMLQSSTLLVASRPPLVEFNKTARLIADVLKNANVPPEQIAVNIAKMYEPLGITVYLDGMGGEKVYTASEIARANGILSTNGKAHTYAVSAIISILKIGDEHKIIKPYQLGETVVISIKYDEYVLNAVSEWICQNKYPAEIPFGLKTYKVKYNHQEDAEKEETN